MNDIKYFLLCLVTLAIVGCNSIQHQLVTQCPSGTLNLPDCPPEDAVDDDTINEIYERRSWVPPSKLEVDPIILGEQAQIPVNSSRIKVIGPSHEDAMRSLATKIWLIDHAQHTIDITYYIFKTDLVGYAILGALCNAVERGVDVRIMVDSIGSLSPGHSALRAVETCTENAGFVRNTNGQITTKKARAQVVVFNAITKFQFNRRSHDKLLVIDGSFPAKAVVMTGGRNISLDYYGIKKDGSPDLDVFRDLEILSLSGEQSSNEKHTVGMVSEIYYSLLFSHTGNRRITPYEASDEFDKGKYQNRYISHRIKAQKSLATIKAFPEIEKQLNSMPDYMNQGFEDAQVRLSHQLSNLTNKAVTTNVVENLERNPNSILYLLSKVLVDLKAAGITSGSLQIVSPYLFSGQYFDEEGTLIYDGAEETLEWLNENPDLKLEVITNSVLTSDNFFTQAIIDMGMAPRFLLTPELQKVWLASTKEGEFNPDIVESEEWKQLINHPQIFFYQTGRLDSDILGGDQHYGKLHAKFIYGEEVGFVGTSNFDYRSNLYNNEMGFFYQGRNVSNDLATVFEQLKATSYRWGTPEWLEMRKKVMESDSSKASPARKQRSIYKTVRALGLEYLL
ncbi:phospholipase D-like domain-containing protein [Alkalimarinus sediminis]|uniref:Phospholipase D-like domain-containing protein n=1 Tax=Alkalimarinus sediminis TaxID=1632866 RepID=A0A9E8HNM0_9ALTE|nr:phospholipase D-like domain-containing protein [Alkalimarinus sediminis]UZW76246.1 phospholipase D-like domain-containing protein [Alkalimarinus sediminis]